MGYVPTPSIGFSGTHHRLRGRNKLYLRVKTRFGYPEKLLDRDASSDLEGIYVLRNTREAEKQCALLNPAMIPSGFGKIKSFKTNFIFYIQLKKNYLFFGIELEWMQKKSSIIFTPISG